MPTLSSTMRQRGVIGAHSKWARTSDRTAATAPGRLASATALEMRLTEEYNLDSDAADYCVRLEHAKRAYFLRLALKSARKRRKAQA